MTGGEKRARVRCQASASDTGAQIWARLLVLHFPSQESEPELEEALVKILLLLLLVLIWNRKPSVIRLIWCHMLMSLLI